jgi:hypothetical protein
MRDLTMLSLSHYVAMVLTTDADEYDKDDQSNNTFESGMTEHEKTHTLMRTQG